MSHLLDFTYLFKTLVNLFASKY